MASWALYVFLFILTLLGGVIGLGLHYWRASFSLYPEELSGNLFIDSMMSNEHLLFEKHIVNAKWDDNGYWDIYSFRNMIYYFAFGASVPLVLALFDWDIIRMIGNGFCTFMVEHGNHSLLCY